MFEHLKIVVIGDVMLDCTVHGDVERISPEAPVPVFKGHHTTNTPGGAANVAMNLVGLGVKTSLIGFWGFDADMVKLEQLMKDSVDFRGMVVTKTHPTISKTRISARGQQLLRLDVEDIKPYPAEKDGELLQNSLNSIDDADAIILSDYAKGALKHLWICRSIIHKARDKKIPIIVDPKGIAWAKYGGSTTICPNMHELAIATGSNSLSAGHKLLSLLGIDYLTVTMSEQGIAILYPDTLSYFPACAKEVFDVTGAGDTVVAVMAASLASGMNEKDAAKLANKAAGIVVGKHGTVPISLQELTSQQKSTDKIFDLGQLMLHTRTWRTQGQKIVFTNGCFDILHMGHISLLEQCRTFGDKVVVAVDSNASVKKAKGPMRPMSGEEERSKLLAALSATDAVNVFDNLLETIKAIKPDVLVKGGDYTKETIIGAKEVESWGGRVEIVPLVKSLSTTAIIKKLGDL